MKITEIIDYVNYLCFSYNYIYIESENGIPHLNRASSSSSSVAKTIYIYYTNDYTGYNYEETKRNWENEDSKVNID